MEMVLSTLLFFMKYQNLHMIYQHYKLRGDYTQVSIFLKIRLLNQTFYTNQGMCIVSKKKWKHEYL